MFNRGSGGGGGGGAVSSVTAGDGTLTISPTTGAVLATRAAITGDVTVAAGSDAATLVATANVDSIIAAQAPVTSVFGRTAGVTASTGDYTAAQVTNAADKSSASEQDFTGVVGSAAGFSTEVVAAGSALTALPSGMTTPVATTPFQCSTTRDVHLMFECEPNASTITNYVLQMSSNGSANWVTVWQLHIIGTTLPVFFFSGDVFVPKGFYLQWSAITGGLNSNPAGAMV